MSEESAPQTDIAALFQRDPLKLTRPDIAAIVSYYRDRRAQFNLGATGAGATKRIKDKAPKGQEKLKTLDIDDLLNS